MVVTVVVLVVAAGGAAAGYLLLRTIGSPQQTAASYLRSWQRSNYAAMQKVSVDVPRSGPTWSTRSARPPWPPRSSTARGSRRS